GSGEGERRDLLRLFSHLRPPLQRLRVTFSGLDRLHHADVHAALLQRKRERGGDERLADARIGAGDEQAVQLVPSSIARRRIVVICSRSCSEIASGGKSVTT